MEHLDPDLFGPEQRCFGCGPRNPDGMKLTFVRDGDTVRTSFTPRPGWEGPPGILHGGLQATLADEVGAWTVVTLLGSFGLTTSMQVRYLRPARMNAPIEAAGEIVEHDRAHAKVQLTLTQDGRELLTGTASYLLPTRDQAEKILGMELPEAWRPLARTE